MKILFLTVNFANLASLSRPRCPRDWSISGTPMLVRESTIAGLSVLSFLLGALGIAESARAAERPNILWLTAEDTTPHLGVYGDEFAVTPTLDALARESICYSNAFAYTGSCSPSRSCLITGVYPGRLGTHHMRSINPLPPEIKPFTTYLRAAGYYTSNNAKEDYQFVPPAGTWDESSNAAHWRKRAPGQPFFSVFNFGVTHQSQIFAPEARYRENTRRLTPAQRRDPAKVPVPPIHPDTPEFRRDWARHYENLTAMDYQVAERLAELEQAGLAEDTIVFFFGDNGTGMPGIKMWAWGPSLHVPLLVRVPKKWQHLAPLRPGDSTDRLVSFVDFAPTILSLAGLDCPSHFQGTAFLGPEAGPARTLVYGGKDRQSELTDSIRTVRDERFQYIRNFFPHQSYGQYMSYNWRAESMKAWERLHLAGELTGAPARYFAARKPVEELYDVKNDPWQVRNLAGDPAYAADVARLRAALRQQMHAIGDLGLISENEMHRRAARTTPYAIATNSQHNPVEKLLRAADLANEMNPRNIAALTALLRDDDAALRWWGATGLLALRSAAAPAKPALHAVLDDSSPDVRIPAAEALAHLGDVGRALPVLEHALRNGNVFIRLGALNAALRLGPVARPLLPAIREAKIEAPDQEDTAEYVGRMVDYLPARLDR